MVKPERKVRKRHRYQTCALVFLALLLGLSSTCVSFSTKITPFDAISKPGEEVELKAKVEGFGFSYFRNDVEEENVAFKLEGAALGVTATDDEGVATLVVTAPEKPGLYSVRIEGPGDAANDLNLLVAGNDAALAVTDIDMTLADVSPAVYVFRSNESIQPIAGAVELIKFLSAEKNIYIVYISHRDDALRNESLEWLKMKGFPDGVLFFSENFDHWMQESAYDFKKPTIEKIKERFPRVLLGLGDKVTDANAYLDNDLPTYIVPSEDRRNFPEEAVLLDDWTKFDRGIVDDLLGN
ncbi:MAG: hypothetical protein NUW37_08720 [Planctomycetes bacterium]|nr:hypothetical protein [Planctomycetota bacterium]